MKLKSTLNHAIRPKYLQTPYLQFIQVGLILLSSFLLYKFVLNQQILTINSIQQSTQNYLNSIDSVPQYKAQEVTTKEQLKAFQKQVKHTQSYTQNKVAPSLDSLRKLAENLGLQVLNLNESEGAVSGYLKTESIDIEGDYNKIIRFIDTLDHYSPALQILQFQWSVDRINRLDRILLGRWSPQAPAPNTENMNWELFVHQSAKLGQSPKIDSITPIFYTPIVVAPSAPKATAIAPVANTPKAPSLSIVGIVAGRLATVQNSSGSRIMLRPGDQIEGWQVKSISGSKIELENGGVVKSYSTK